MTIPTAILLLGDPPILLWAAEPDPLRGFGKTPTVAVLATAPRLRAFQP